MRTFPQPRPARVALLLSALLLAVAPGCQLISYTVAAFFPKPKVKPVYDFAKTERLLVFPDDQFHPLTYPPLKDMLAEKLGREMVRRGLADETVAFASFQAVRTRLDRRHRDVRGAPAPLDEIARAVEADRVLYVDIRRFRLRDNPVEPVWRGHLAVRVRVVDADGECLWPIVPVEGVEIVVETPASTDDGRSHDVALRERLTDEMTDKIAKLFYEHRQDS